MQGLETYAEDLCVLGNMLETLRYPVDQEPKHRRYREISNSTAGF